MADFTVVDFVIVGFFFLSTALGFARGLFKEFISIAAVFLGLVIMVRYTAPVAGWLNQSAGAQDVVSSISQFFGLNVSHQLNQMTTAITLLLLFMIPYSLGEAVNFYGVVEAFIIPQVLPILYRLLGAGVGFLRGYAFNLIFIIFMELTPVAAWDVWTHSALVPALQSNATALADRLQPNDSSNTISALRLNKASA